MANASNETLGRIAFRQFAVRNFGMNIGRGGSPYFLNEPQFLSRNLTNRISYIERFGWLRVGFDLGYFATNQDELRSIQSEIREAFNPIELSTPGNFVVLMASLIAENSLHSNPRLLSNDSAVLGKFQAALLAAEAFDDPLLITLVSELRSPEGSVLDSVEMKIDPDEIYAALNNDFEEIQSDSQLQKASIFVAGMSRLTCVFQAFADLFPESIDEEREEFFDPVLLQAISTLVSWRVDVSDERTDLRMRNLTYSFLNFVNAVRLSNADQFDWPMGITIRKSFDLMKHWTSFTNGEIGRHELSFGPGVSF